MGWRVNRHGYAGGVAGARTILECKTQRSSFRNAILTSLDPIEIVVDVALATGVGTGTLTIASAIPAGTFDVWVTATVINVLAGVGLTTWSLGVTGDVDRFAAAKAKTAGTTVTAADYAADNACFDVYQAATNILFTAAAGQFDTGKVTIVIFAKSLTAPSN